MEKEARLREGMQMMGLPAWVLDASWALTAVGQMTLTSALIVAATTACLTRVFCHYSFLILVYM